MVVVVTPSSLMTTYIDIIVTTYAVTGRHNKGHNGEDLLPKSKTQFRPKGQENGEEAFPSRVE